jgi:TPR repeat protein
MTRLKNLTLKFGVCVVCLLVHDLLLEPVYADDYEEGRNAYITGAYKQALAVLKPLAEAGDPGAQKIMGIMYDYGQGVEKDPEQALFWYTLSANQGDPAVQYQVGAKYFRGDGVAQDYHEAARWWEQAANGGQVDAQFNLGLMYYRALSVQRNNQRAAELFRQAADQGHSYAQYSLAVMYSFGQGVQKDFDAAFQWFRKSAQQGVAEAQFNMGVYYDNGYGVDKNPAEAKLWYERASAQGLEEATRKLAGLEPDIKQTPNTGGMDYTIDEISTTTINREDWVVRQKPEFYTLQIGSVLKEKDIIDFINENHLESDAAYIKVVVNDVTRYSAFYGVYESYDQAKSAIDRLPENLRKVKPWIRNFNVLQSMLK